MNFEFILASNQNLYLSARSLYQFYIPKDRPLATLRRFRFFLRDFILTTLYDRTHQSFSKTEPREVRYFAYIISSFAQTVFSETFSPKPHLQQYTISGPLRAALSGQAWSRPEALSRPWGWRCLELQLEDDYCSIVASLKVDDLRHHFSTRGLPWGGPPDVTSAILWNSLSLGYLAAFRISKHQRFFPMA